MNEETHLNALAKLCRICGVIQSERGGTFYNVAEYQPDLDVTFDLNTLFDEKDIHPSRFCTKCFYKVNNFKQKSIKSSKPLIWMCHKSDHCETCTLATKQLKGGRPKKVKSHAGRPKAIKTLDDVMNLDPSKPIPPSLDKAISHVIEIKINQSLLLNKSIQFSSGGPQPLTLTPIHVPRKETEHASKRAIRDRSKQSKDIISIISGNTSSTSSFIAQTADIVKSLNEVSRDNIIKGLNVTTTIPANHVAAMKATQNIPWNLLREIRRWLSTFNVKIDSESKVREVAKLWVGKGLKCEYAPLIMVKNKIRVVKPVPWCYLYNLVGHVIARLNDLKECNLLVHHAFIPDEEIHVKVGGDHGGGSFKMSYQIANVNHPNKLDNTVIFSIFEAKDSCANLRICLERFKMHIDKLKTLTWSNKLFRCFMFGDYEFLSHMFGISGAAGKHPCLWCHISSGEMQYPKFMREQNMAEKRTLENLKSNYDDFCFKYNRNIKFAKNVFNVIGDVFFEISIEQVCLPGLHMTLGIFLKIFREIIESYCAELDNEINNNNLFTQSKHLKNALEELKTRKELVENEIDWLSISNEEFNLLDYQIILDTLQNEIEFTESEFDYVQRQVHDQDAIGPCVKSLDQTLAKMGVERQVYYSNIFIGNHCHILLKEENIDKLCNSIPEILLSYLGETEVYRSCISEFEKIRKLLNYYSKCDNIFNVARHLSEKEIECFKSSVNEFMCFLRVNWPKVNVSPKLHFLEDHMYDFLFRWKTGCGFYGEQGIESAHNGINKMKERYSHIKNDLNRLQYIMNQHLLSTNPKAQITKPKMKVRNLKRKSSE